MISHSIVSLVLIVIFFLVGNAAVAQRPKQADIKEAIVSKTSYKRMVHERILQLLDVSNYVPATKDSSLLRYEDRYDVITINFPEPNSITTTVVRNKTSGEILVLLGWIAKVSPSNNSSLVRLEWYPIHDDQIQQFLDALGYVNRTKQTIALLDDRDDIVEYFKWHDLDIVVTFTSIRVYWSEQEGIGGYLNNVNRLISNLVRELER